jgi:indolepyruvate ferredoxin oxidoreductase beta subunit
VSDRPTTILVAAMGGEGGGVLSDWLVSAAEAEGLVVQSTSIPGVAQRTGATTYYIEMLRPSPVPGAQPQPVMSLYPVIGDIDVMVATELVEAGRAVQNGFVTPDRTTLIASTHRVYAIGERTAMSDGRFDTDRVVRAVEELSRDAILFDMDKAARDTGSVINAVILGAIAGSGRLPIPTERFEAAIRGGGRGVEASLKAFRLGLERAAGKPPAEPADLPSQQRRTVPDDLRARIEQFPDGLRDILREGVARLVDYQDAAEAALYLDRLGPIVAAETGASGNLSLSREVARHLALWMSYEDVIRVAQAKLRPERMARVRAEVAAKAGEPVVIAEYLKPGLEEFCALLPPALAKRLVAWAERTGRTDSFNFGMHVPSTAIWGFLLLRTLAGMRRFRRRGYRYELEHAAMRDWLANVESAAGLSLGLAREVAECARLLKGYSDTYRRGRRNFAGIMTTLVKPTLAGEMEPDAAAAAIRQAREAALADPEGGALDKVLATPPAPRLRQSA